MSTLKVVVTALRRYWAAGRCWEAGETEAVLEDTPERSLESQLAELDAAKGGDVLEQSGLERSNPVQRAPCALSYRIVIGPVRVVVYPPPEDRLIVADIGFDPPAPPAVTECCATPEAEKVAAEADAALAEEAASQQPEPA